MEVHYFLTGFGTGRGLPAGDERTDGGTNCGGAGGRRAMTYGVILGKGWFYDTLLDGFFEKELLLHTSSDFVERLGLCDKCCGYMAHVICDDLDPEGYTNKYCPILFHDLIKPSWKLEQVNGFTLNKKESKKLAADFRRHLSGAWTDE